MSNDMRALRRKLTREGWECVQGKNHYKCYHPLGGFVVMSATPSDRFAVKNARGDIERLIKQHDIKKQ